MPEKKQVYMGGDSPEVAPIKADNTGIYVGNYRNPNPPHEIIHGKHPWADLNTGPVELVINRPGDCKEIMRFNPATGELKLGEGVTLTEAAQMFWAEIGKLAGQKTFVVPSRVELRKLVDICYQEFMEQPDSVPSTDWADKLIDKVFGA